MVIAKNIIKMCGFELRRILNLVKKQEFRYFEARKRGYLPAMFRLKDGAYMIMYGESLRAYNELIEDLHKGISFITKEELGSLLGYLLPKIIEQDNDTIRQTEIDNFFAELERLSLAQWTLYAPLNIKLDADLEIGGIMIRVPNTEFWKFLEDPSFSGYKRTYQQISQLPCIKLKITASTPNYAIMLGKKVIEDYLNFIKLILTTFTIERIEVISYYFVTKDHTKYYPQIETPWIPELELVGDRRKFFDNNLSKMDFPIPIIEKAIEDPNSLTDIEERVYKAMRWLGRGKSEDDDLIKFINYVTAAEILTVVDRSKITSNFTQIIGFLAHSSKEERKAVEKRAGKLYDKRSKILHTGLSEITKEEIYDMESFVRDLILFFSYYRTLFTTLKQFHGFSNLLDIIYLVTMLMK